MPSELSPYFVAFFHLFKRFSLEFDNLNIYQITIYSLNQPFYCDWLKYENVFIQIRQGIFI